MTTSSGTVFFAANSSLPVDWGSLCIFAVILRLTPCYFDRLLDIVHADQKLYLVFEFLDVDLKRYMENGNRSGNPISLDLVKVSLITLSSYEGELSLPRACRTHAAPAWRVGRQRGAF